MNTNEKITVGWFGISIVGIIVGLFSKDFNFTLHNMALAIALGLLIVSEKKVHNLELKVKKIKKVRNIGVPSK